MPVVFRAALDAYLPSPKQTDVETVSAVLVRQAVSRALNNMMPVKTILKQVRHRWEAALRGSSSLCGYFDAKRLLRRCVACVARHYMYCYVTPFCFLVLACRVFFVLFCFLLSPLTNCVGGTL